MSIDLTATLSELVAIPSVNPMGRDVAGPEFFEYRVTDYLQAFFERLKIPWYRQSIEPLRDNIIARIDGNETIANGGGVILFEAHQDTVPVDGMTIEPWTPNVIQGRLYGRGSCDIKGGMTAMLGALARLATERPAEMPTVVMACTINEEHGYSGANQLAELWSDDGQNFIPRRPDVAIIAEPTNLDVVVAHKGAVRWRCKTPGVAGHSSQPERATNALYRMARVLMVLQRYQDEVCPTLSEHHLCGQPTLSVGVISGGLSVNTVPDACTIEIDRRVTPLETTQAAYEHVLKYLQDAPEIDFPVENEPPFLQGEPLPDQENGPLAEQLQATVNELFGSCDIVGVPYGTDASKIAKAGVPSVVFGPGSIEQAHTADEWLSLDELSRASEAYYAFARTGLPIR